MSIKKHTGFPRRLLLVFGFALLLVQGAAAQSVVRISGTGSGTGGMQLLAQAFMRANPAVKAEVLPALGSSGGIASLIAGQIDLAVSNRLPKENELARQPLLSIEYARTPFVVAVHKDLGVTGLSSAQLAALFAEGAATFPNGKRSRPVMRLSDATDTELLKSFSPEVSHAVEAAAKRRGMLNADTDSETADLIERTAGAFGASTLALIESEKRALIALSIDAKQATVAHLIDGSYPYYKPLYLIVSASAGQNTKMFATFVQSEPGRALLRAHGHAPR